MEQEKTNITLKELGMMSLSIFLLIGVFMFMFNIMWLLIKVAGSQ